MSAVEPPVPPDEPGLLRPIVFAEGEKIAPPTVRDRPGREKFEIAELPMELLERSPREAEIPGFRPEKAEAFYVPRVMATRRPRKLKRFNGKTVLGTENVSHIFNGESRSILTDTSYPWRCVGKLMMRSADGSRDGNCTAALVGRRLILTAAHCIPFGEVGKRVAMTFVPAYANGVSRLGSAFQAKVNGVAYWEKVSGDVCGYDMAVCRLDVPLGDRLGSFGLKVYNDDWEDLRVFASVGYPFDIASGQQPAVETGIAVVDDDGDSYDTLEVETKADTASGASGGPLFANWGGKPYIIGTGSGIEEEFSVSLTSFTETHGVYAGGNGLIRLVKWARENWDK